MRHQTKKNTLGKAKDQREALLRSLATELFTHGEIKTTMARAKALRPYAENIISMAKVDSVHSRRQASKFIYDKDIEGQIDVKTKELVEEVKEGQKVESQTVLRKLFNQIGKKYSSRQGGYTRIYRLPPRRGDASEMALIQLV
ncbi:MAG: 50S ribosomal protein L17 [bacterium]|nr:50S ribosomal protein L17 [bacterium]